MVYSTIKKWRDSEMERHDSSSQVLNEFHDAVMKKVHDTALEKQTSKYGSPPCHYSWFVMGSGGRFEQAIISDQDHGLVYKEDSQEAASYFLKFGKELANGLNEVGYPFCDGNVMSSNPVWCRSKTMWNEQLAKWLKEESFESIRFLLIFYDARVLVGDRESILELKTRIHDYIQQNPHFLERLLENTQHVKKAVGFFHQFLTETHGSYAGSIDLKQTGFFPYVNNIRLLAIKESVVAESTLSRIEELLKLPRYKKDLGWCRTDFEKLLHYRLQYHKKMTENYDDIHYLDVKQLNKDERKEMKHILLNGQKLLEYTQSIIKGMMRR